jgi:hypothetical protein
LNMWCPRIVCPAGVVTVATEKKKKKTYRRNGNSGSRQMQIKLAVFRTLRFLLPFQFCEVSQSF